MTITTCQADHGRHDDETEIFRQRESEVRSYCRHFDVVFDSARGSVLVDTAGRKYIDFLAGCSALNYGHNDPDMQQALPTALAIAASSLLYVAVADLIPSLHRRPEPILTQAHRPARRPRVASPGSRSVRAGRRGVRVQRGV